MHFEFRCPIDHLKDSKAFCRSMANTKRKTLKMIPRASKRLQVKRVRKYNGFYCSRGFTYIEFELLKQEKL